MTRTTAKYLGLLALAITVFHWKTLLTDQFTTLVGYEAINQTYSWLHVWVKSIWSGHIPWWDPHAFGGRPFTEEMEAFYPIRLLFALVPLNRNGLVSPRFFHEYLEFNRFLGACFMFALLREFRRSHFASFVGACAFVMGGLLGKLPWPQYLEACIWLPAIFLFVLRALRSEDAGRRLLEASLGGLCMGMSVLTGGVQFAMIQGIFIAAAVIYFGALSSTQNHRAGWLRSGVVLAATVVAALGIGAAQLLPSFEYGHLALRSISGGWLAMDQKIPYDRLVRGMWPESIITGVFPVGGPMGGEEAWAYYIGVFPMFLAVTAIWKCWSNLWVRFLAILSVIVFAYTLGEFSPLFGALYATVPFLWMARGASRFVYLISFSLAILAAFGLDTLLDSAGQREFWAPAKPFLKWIAISCSIAILVPGIFTQITLGIWPCLSLLLVISSCAWFYRFTLNPAPIALRVMLTGFIIFDLTVFNWQETNKNQMEKSTDAYEVMLSMKGACDFIRKQPGLYRTTTDVPTLPNLGDIYGLQGLWGGGATVLKSFSMMRPREDLLNVRYRVKPASTADAGAVYQDKLWKVYEDAAAYPRAWVVHQTLIEPSDDAVFKHAYDNKTDFHKIGIVAAALPTALDANASNDAVRFRSYEAGSMALDVNASGTGLLVLSEMYYPGWQATVNGRDAEIRKADGAFRGILVPRGASLVELRYVPVTAYAGAAMSLGMAGCILLGWFLVRRRPYAGSTQLSES
jgi:hypothetical protein